MVPTYFHLNPQPGLQNRDASWMPAVKLNQAVALIVVVMLDVLSLPVQINTATGPQYKAFDLENVFLSYPFQKRGTETVIVHLEVTRVYICSLAPGLC